MSRFGDSHGLWATKPWLSPKRLIKRQPLATVATLATRKSLPKITDWRVLEFDRPSLRSAFGETLRRVPALLELAIARCEFLDRVRKLAALRPRAVSLVVP